MGHRRSAHPLEAPRPEPHERLHRRGDRAPRDLQNPSRDRRRGLTHTEYADQIGVSTQALRSVLTGQRLPTVEDLAAAVAVFTASVLPEPAAIRELLRGPQEALRTQKAASQAGRDGLTHAIDGYRSLAALGAPPDAVVEQPLTAIEHANEQRLQATAGPLIAEATGDLSGADRVDANICLARDTYLVPPGVVGYAEDGDADLYVRLLCAPARLLG
jgi:transcriptional regulator with XRE-family HTH domain